LTTSPRLDSLSLLCGLRTSFNAFEAPQRSV